MIKKIWICCIAGFFGILAAQAQIVLTSGAQVTNVRIDRENDVLFVTMNLEVDDVEVKPNRSVVFTPVFYNEEYSKELPTVKVMGKKRYIKYQRKNGGKNKESKTQVIRYTDQLGKAINYQTSFAYQDWMKKATLRIDEDVCGCSNTILGTDYKLLETTDFEPPVFSPLYVYINPQVEAIKERNESGSAYLNFPVNKIEINPTFGNNAFELKKINEAINVVKNDPDVEINEVFIKGVASPEGSYKNNERLAKGRTEALENYVQEQMRFKKQILATSYEAEDWIGLRKYVASSNMKEKKGILSLIDSSMDLDAKEKKIRSTYPEAYRHLLDNCYPSLRRTDYVIKYTVKAFDVNEAKRVLKTRPQKLSQQEMYLVAQTYEVGSPGFNETFDVAIRMFPEDPTANLNAANIAMLNNLLPEAAKYLNKAGNSPQAVHARGILAGLNGEYEVALKLMDEAHERGVSEAVANKEQIEKCMRR